MRMGILIPLQDDQGIPDAHPVIGWDYCNGGYPPSLALQSLQGLVWVQLCMDRVLVVFPSMRKGCGLHSLQTLPHQWAATTMALSILQDTFLEISQRFLALAVGPQLAVPVEGYS